MNVKVKERQLASFTSSILKRIRLKNINPVVQYNKKELQKRIAQYSFRRNDHTLTFHQQIKSKNELESMINMEFLPGVI